MNTEFHSQLSKFVKQRDLGGANHLVMRELAKSLVKSKQDFVDLLMYSGVSADLSMNDMQLVDKYLDNVHRNEKLLIGSAFLVNKNNQMVGFDGIEEISDNGVKHTVLVLNSYFDNTPAPEVDPNEDFYATSSMNPNEEDDFYNVGGVGGIVGSILEQGGAITNKVMEGQQKKKYGALDMATKKQEAKQQMASQIMEQRRAEIDAKSKAQAQKAKTTKMALIIGGSVLGLIIIAGVIYAIKSSKK